jgi:hypothetical protein
MRPNLRRPAAKRRPSGRPFIGTDKLLTLGHYSSATYFRNWLLQASTASHCMDNREGSRILKLFVKCRIASMPAVRPELRNGQGEAWLKAWSVI